jgi:hypothetical protein
MSVGLGGLAAGFAIGIVGCVVSSFACLSAHQQDVPVSLPLGVPCLTK